MGHLGSYCLASIGLDAIDALPFGPNSDAEKADYTIMHQGVVQLT
jgi:hypothetical protein